MLLGVVIMNGVPELRLSKSSEGKKEHAGMGMNGAKQSLHPAEIFLFLFLSKKRIRS